MWVYIGSEHTNVCEHLISFPTLLMSPHSRLVILVLLLTLSNLGTSFAAAYLAKDTSINDKEELVHANSKQTVSTQTTAAHYGVESLPQEDGEDGRRMQEDSCFSYVDEDGIEVTDCTPASGYFINDNTRTGACDSIVRQCLNKNAVDLDRTYGNGEVKSFPICGLDTTVSINERKGRVTLKNPSMSKINLQYTDDGCKFDGDDLMQVEGDPCDFGSDCIRGTKCYKMDQERVRICESTCASSFQKTRQKNRCFNACGGNTCERINDYMILAGTTYEPTESPSLSPTTPRPTPLPTTPRPTRTPRPTPLPTTPKPTGSPSPTYGWKEPSMAPSSNPTATSRPSKSSAPSLRPSLSSAPSVSTHPSQSPSLSSAPSKSSAPSNSPTGLQSNAPSKSSAPTNFPNMIACPPAYTGTGQATFELQGFVWEADGNGNWVKIGKCVNNIVVYGLFI